MERSGEKEMNMVLWAHLTKKSWWERVRENCRESIPWGSDTWAGAKDSESELDQENGLVSMSAGSTCKGPVEK